MSRLIPKPKKYVTLNKDACIIPYYIFSECEDWQMHILAFSDTFLRGYARSLKAGKRGGIELIHDGSVANNAYRLTTDGTLRIYASTSEGICYGLASALQLSEPTDSGIKLHALEIEDYPDKDYRSIMVDVGREWHPFDKLLKFVDLCFFYKVKYLNLHFADNKIYTLPSRAFPKLCVDGMYYTEEQIRHLREYAKARGVVLIPEFECPGHAPVLNTYYPEVFADRSEGEGNLFYNESGEIISNSALLCASRESAVEGVKILLSEIAELFPEAPYIHIGGDEANIALWDQCSDCREYMKNNGIDDVYGLYSDYVARIARHVLSLGKTPIVWEGFPEKGADKIPPETIVISWENHYQTTHQLLGEGFKLINSSWKPLYIVPANTLPDSRFSWGAKDIYDWNVYNWQHWWEHSVATKNPINIEPTEQVIGAMLCAWEMTFEQEINHVMTNLPALAERTWTTDRICDYEDFRRRFHGGYHLLAKVIQDR
jgi:hexosaminidase